MFARDFSGNMTGDLTGNVTGTVSSIGNHNSDALSEGSENLYYSDERARAAVGVLNSGGDGALSYNSTTGKITYSGPSSDEIRAHFSAGSGIEINAGQIALSQPLMETDDVRFQSVTSNLIGQVMEPDQHFITELRRLHRIGDGGGILRVESDLIAERNVFIMNTMKVHGVLDVEGMMTGNISGNISGTVSSIDNHTTDNLTEGLNNLYHTDERVRSAIEIVDNGGDGALSYDNTSGKNHLCWA